jgi:hypothetical protein
MEANQMGDNEFNQFIKITKARHLNPDQLLKEKYCVDTNSNDLEISKKQLHEAQLQKLRDLHYAFKKHR